MIAGQTAAGFNDGSAHGDTDDDCRAACPSSDSMTTIMMTMTERDLDSMMTMMTGLLATWTQ